MAARRGSVTLDVDSAAPAVVAAVAASSGAAARRRATVAPGSTETPDVCGAEAVLVESKRGIALVLSHSRRASLPSVSIQSTAPPFAAPRGRGSLVAAMAQGTRMGRELAAAEEAAGVTTTVGFVGADGMGDGGGGGAGGRRGSASGLADVAARGSLAAAVSHAYVDRRRRLEEEAIARDRGFDDGDEASRAAAARAEAAAAKGGLASEEDRERAERAEAQRRYLAMRRVEVAAKLRALAKVDPLTTRYFGLLCKLRDGHALGVYCAQYADDGNLVVSGSHDSTAICWDIAKQELKRTYRGHMGEGLGAAWRVGWVGWGACRWLGDGLCERLRGGARAGRSATPDALSVSARVHYAVPHAKLGLAPSVQRRPHGSALPPTGADERTNTRISILSAGPVYSARWAPTGDNDRVLTASEDQTVKVRSRVVLLPSRAVAYATRGSMCVRSVVRGDALRLHTCIHLLKPMQPGGSSGISVPGSALRRCASTRRPCTRLSGAATAAWWPRAVREGGSLVASPSIVLCVCAVAPGVDFHYVPLIENALPLRRTPHAAGGDSCMFVYDVERVMAVAARVAAGEWVPQVDEEERVLVRIGASPDHIGEGGLRASLPVRRGHSSAAVNGALPVCRGCSAAVHGAGVGVQSIACPIWK